LSIVGGVESLIRPDRYPLASAYDPAWLLRLDMGPNPLWLLEDLTQDLDLDDGMRVLDLGSGRGATSVFLAREFGVEVVAADWWIPAEEAGAVFREAGVDDRVTAVHAEAHNLPFEWESFDAVVSIDAFEYFGTADSYLPYLTKFLKAGGQIGMATPAMTKEVRDIGAIPAHIRDLVGWEAIAWHTPEWWKFQWEITDLVTVTSARWQEDGWKDWLLWAHATDHGQATVDMLTTDQGEYLGFTLITATKN
jgi:SAM-dependent methyltransferase